jgi:putative ABC transport system substrate-binding protein
MSTLTTPLGAKGVGLLKELLPKAALIGYLVNPSNPSGKLETAEANSTADALGVRVRAVNASTIGELDKAFATLGKMHVDGVVVAGEPFFDSQREKIVASPRLCDTGKLRVARERRCGRLMSYGASLTDSYRQAGIYAGRILKGEKPADLP